MYQSGLWVVQPVSATERLARAVDLNESGGGCRCPFALISRCSSRSITGGVGASGHA
jgi:hypothetical protein